MRVADLSFHVSQIDASVPWHRFDDLALGNPNLLAFLSGRTIFIKKSVSILFKSWEEIPKYEILVIWFLGKL